MTGRPDPKPSKKKGNKARRIVNPDAVLRAKLLFPMCAACGDYGANGHHVLPKDKGGDDLICNIVSLCGSGTARCHGAHHGSPYVVGDVRRDAEWVNRRIGAHLLEHRWDVVDYVLVKMGQVAGADFLLRVYYADLHSSSIVH